MEDSGQFESRKRDHIELALQDKNQSTQLNKFESVELIHEALPEINFNDISIETTLLGQSQSKPFFVSSMTAGHGDAIGLNMRLARVCQERGWPMGVGSQRRQLYDHEARREWQVVRQFAPQVVLFGNLGLAQVIQTPTKIIQELVDSLEATAMIIHLNALQECIQPEGTPQFGGGFAAIARLVKELNCPVIVKETGCGMSLSTLKKISDTGVQAIDVSGAGGTHWGRIEGQRAQNNKMLSRVSETYAHWGLSTVSSLMESQKLDKWSGEGRVEIWSSGGIRTGLEAAKSLALGAKMVGFAKPALESALKSDEALSDWMEIIEYELKVAMFCTGSRQLGDLKDKVRVSGSR